MLAMGGASERGAGPKRIICPYLHIALQHLCTHVETCKTALVCCTDWPKLVFTGVGNLYERVLVLAHVLPDLQCTLGRYELVGS